MSTLFSDNFNLGTAPLASADWDIGYTGENDPTIVSNVVQPGAITTRGSATVKSISAPNDQWAQVTIAAASSAFTDLIIQVLLRASGPPTVTWYECQLLKANASFTSRIRYRTAAGSATTLVSENATTWAATDTLYGDVIGTTIRLYRNGGPGVGTLILSTTDSNLASGRVGFSLFVDNTSGTVADAEIDNFSCGDFSAASSGDCIVSLLGTTL